jgi:DNA-binding NarL/FixJ family response regulator
LSGRCVKTEPQFLRSLSFMLSLNMWQWRFEGERQCPSAPFGRGRMRKIAEVFLLAENRLLREVLIRLLSKSSELRIVGANSYSPGIHHEIIAAHPQIILLDSSGLSSPRSTLIATLRSALRNLRIVMVDMDPDESTFLGAIRAGVMGYVLKDASAVEVAATIRAVAAGRAVCPPSLCMALFRCVSQQTLVAPPVSWTSDFGLSRREREMLELLRQRLTNKEMALRLNLSEQTVKNHVHHILRKMGAADRFALVELCESRRVAAEQLTLLERAEAHKRDLFVGLTPELLKA